MQRKAIWGAHAVPDVWYNINADLPFDLPPILPNDTPFAIADEGTYPKEILATTLSRERYIPIPGPVYDLYRIWRPTPLLRAKRLEEALKTPAKLYFKLEGTSPSGSHKLNGTIPQAYYAAKEGFKGMVTPTGGQWGTAFAYSCRLFGFEPVVFMMRQSVEHRPMRTRFMNLFGAKVFRSPCTETEYGREVLARNPEHPGSLAIATSEVREYVSKRPGFVHSRGELLHQTVSGLEARDQLIELGDYPDVIVAVLGYGSKL